MHDILFLRPRELLVFPPRRSHTSPMAAQARGEREDARLVSPFYTAEFTTTGGVLCSLPMPASLGCGKASEKALTLLPARKQSLPLIPEKS